MSQNSLFREDLHAGQRQQDPWYYEALLHDQGFSFVAGVDEVGRGCLAGPVVAAAVILPFDLSDLGITDSKALSPLEREALDKEIRARAVAFSIAQVDSVEIDRINILQASLKAMAKAVLSLSPSAAAVLVDGNQSVPNISLPQKTLTKGELRSCSIAAASILAKVYRDRLMVKYSMAWPQYGFERHKGYGTALHRKALEIYGPSPIHRRSFKGVIPA